MKVYTYSQARQNLSELLNQALTEEVIIRRRYGATFSIVPKVLPQSPFDVVGIKVKVTTGDILDAIRPMACNSWLCGAPHNQEIQAGGQSSPHDGANPELTPPRHPRNGRDELQPTVS